MLLIDQPCSATRVPSAGSLTSTSRSRARAPGESRSGRVAATRNAGDRAVNPAATAARSTAARSTAARSTAARSTAARSTAAGESASADPRVDWPADPQRLHAGHPAAQLPAAGPGAAAAAGHSVGGECSAVSSRPGAATPTSPARCTHFADLGRPRSRGQERSSRNGVVQGLRPVRGSAARREGLTRATCCEVAQKRARSQDCGDSYCEVAQK
jgi:hypothetical protein